MDLIKRKLWQADFERFFAPFARFFKREDSRQSAQRYIRGLLAEVERKNCWQMAEVMGQARPDGMQRLLYGAEWAHYGMSMVAPSPQNTPQSRQCSEVL